MRLGGRDVPVLLPRLRDPRLHVAAVIVSVQVLGQVSLGFDVSVAQILVCLATCALLEVPITLWEKGVLAWPASALLTGNGVALLLRVPGTEHGDWWSLDGWSIFVAAAAVSLLSKYAVRYRGRHVFNPSNLGLVVVFVVFGADQADPQDLWWGPWTPILALTVGLIIVGGVTLSARLHLFDVAIGFWATFAVGIGIIAIRGHAITARWSLGPVAGRDYWRILVTSPEILIFVFFMITDPRTSPVGRRARLVYGIGTGALAAVLASMQTTEYATKVALLAALTIVCGVRPLIQAVAARRSTLAATAWRGPRTVLGEAAVGAAVLGLVAVLLVLAPTTSVDRRGSAAVEVGEAGRRPEVDVPGGVIPDVSISPSVREVDGSVGAAVASSMGRDLVEDLAIEGLATRTLSPDLVGAASFGARQRATVTAIAQAAELDQPFERRHQLGALEVVVLRDPNDPQALPQLGIVATGEVTDVVFADRRASAIESQDTTPFDAAFLLAPVDGTFLIGRELAADDPMVRR